MQIGSNRKLHRTDNCEFTIIGAGRLLDAKDAALRVEGRMDVATAAWAGLEMIGVSWKKTPVGPLFY